MNQYRPTHKAMVPLLALMLCLGTFAAGETIAKSSKTSNQQMPIAGIIVFGQAANNVAGDSSITCDFVAQPTSGVATGSGRVGS